MKNSISTSRGILMYIQYIHKRHPPAVWPTSPLVVHRLVLRHSTHLLWGCPLCTLLLMPIKSKYLPICIFHPSGVEIAYYILDGCGSCVGRAVFIVRTQIRFKLVRKRAFLVLTDSTARIAWITHFNWRYLISCWSLTISDAIRFFLLQRRSSVMVLLFTSWFR